MCVIKEANEGLVNNTSAFSRKELNDIYNGVIRDGTDQPGFYYEDYGDQIDSKAFRQRMVELKEGLSNLCKFRSNKQLNYQWMGRFSHQHTSGFHRDSAAEHSFLILGYEPTNIDSRVYLADYTKMIENQNISLETYFDGNQDVNVASNDSQIEAYVTELTPFPKNHYRLLVINNSKSFKEKTYGVFHRGEVLQKMDGEDRVLNSLMLCLCDITIEEQHSPEAIMNFVNTDNVNR